MKCIIYINFTCFFSLFCVATRKFESTEVAGICDSHDVSLADSVLKLPSPAPGRGLGGKQHLGPDLCAFSLSPLSQGTVQLRTG